MARASRPATDPEQGAAEPAGGVAAVERALLIVSAIEASDTPSELSEIAARTDLYKSTILRLLGTLISAGYVTRLSDGRYDLGPTSFRLGAAFSRRNAIAHRVLPALHALVDRGTESASFHVRQDAETRTCLFRVNSHHATLDRIEAGGSYPMKRGAAGHVILAYTGGKGPRYDEIRATGFAVSLGERDPSCAGLAAPVFGHAGTLIGAISLSGPRERFGKSEIERMKTLLGPVAKELTLSLGGQWPDGLRRSPLPQSKAGKRRASA
ncbi:MAG: IclR family transcriptional regulator [Hyphomicrobiales bacterium]|nr:MAG: IclR family transcriptional regulator [Hyphomicrobiales bacterium]